MELQPCLGFDYQLLHGELAGVGSYTLTGAECSIGTTGDHDLLGVPTDNLYFLVVGLDDTGTYESSWGADSTGAERNGGAASGQCNVSTKVTTETCP